METLDRSFFRSLLCSPVILWAYTTEEYSADTPVPRDIGKWMYGGGGNLRRSKNNAAPYLGNGNVLTSEEPTTPPTNQPAATKTRIKSNSQPQRTRRDDEREKIWQRRCLPLPVWSQTQNLRVLCIFRQSQTDKNWITLYLRILIASVSNICFTRRHVVLEPLPKCVVADQWGNCRKRRRTCFFVSPVRLCVRKQVIFVKVRIKTCSVSQKFLLWVGGHWSE